MYSSKETGTNGKLKQTMKQVLTKNIQRKR